MQLKDFQYGMLVKSSRDIGKDLYEVGMVVGVSNNCPHAEEQVRCEVGRAVFVVKWSSGRESTIHPANVTPFK